MATNPHFRFLENVFREVPAPGFHRPTDLAVNPPYNQLDETCMVSSFPSSKIAFFSNTR